MTTILIGAVIGLVFGLAFGNNKSEPKEWKPKKKSLFDSICDIKDISHSPSKRYRR
jgi:hypothetical protein